MEALQEGEIVGAGLDVFDKERPVKDNPCQSAAHAPERLKRPFSVRVGARDTLKSCR